MSKNLVAMPQTGAVQAAEKSWPTPPAASERVAKLTADRTTVSLDGELRAASWKPPANISDDMRTEVAEAYRAMHAYGRAFAAPAGGVQIETERGARPLAVVWVSRLSMRTIARDDGYSEAGWLAEHAALVGRYPASIVTEEALDRAARRFKFRPGYQELADFLDGEQRSERTRMERMLAIAKPRGSVSGAAAQDEQPVNRAEIAEGLAKIEDGPLAETLRRLGAKMGVIAEGEARQA